MRSNAVYRILDAWRAVVFWLPLSKVTICDEFGNVNDEVMIYYDIYNHDQNQNGPGSERTLILDGLVSLKSKQVISARAWRSIRRIS